ncbi:Tfp pilus assembly protein FimT/FimU [Patescibacteria group bacterium]
MLLVKNKNGFSLIEVLITLGVLVILLVAMTPSFFNFYHRYQLQTKTQETIQVLRLAQSLSMAGQNGEVYGVRLITGWGGGMVLFQGHQFDGRDQDYDQEYLLPQSVSLSATVSDNEVLFNKFEGSTQDIGTITISSAAGSKSITINQTGRIDLQ